MEVSLIKNEYNLPYEASSKERVMLFREYSRKAKHNSPKLLNSRDELHGACDCGSRFLRLRAIGNDEATEGFD